MTEIKCIEGGCANEAHYIDGGSSYCQVHYPKAHQKTLAARWVYVMGVLLWAGIWLWMFGLAGPRPRVLVDTILPLYSGHYWVFAIPIGIGFVVLVINLFLWWNPRDYADYKTEVVVIEFVERNASWFLIASGAFLTAASFFLTRPPGTSPMLPPPPLARQGLIAVLGFESASLLLLLFVVLLYWIPPDPKRLARLRHLKTLPFTYSVSFFAAAFTALVIAATS